MPHTFSLFLHRVFYKHSLMLFFVTFVFSHRLKLTQTVKLTRKNKTLIKLSFLELILSLISLFSKRFVNSIGKVLPKNLTGQFYTIFVGQFISVQIVALNTNLKVQKSSSVPEKWNESWPSVEAQSKPVRMQRTILDE